MDSFTIAVLAGGTLVIVIFAVLILFDKKGKDPVPPPAIPTKPAGRR